VHAHTHIIHVTFSFLSINSTDQENPPPDAYGVGERQAGAQNRGTKTTAVQSNMRGASYSTDQGENLPPDACDARDKQVCGIVAPRLQLFSLTGEEPAMGRERAG